MGDPVQRSLFGDSKTPLEPIERREPVEVLSLDDYRRDSELGDLEGADQVGLFGESLDDFTVWRREWRGMPEFVQDDLTPWNSVLIHFASREDMDRFARLIEQNLTRRTQSVWYPKAEIGHFIDKRYADRES